LGLKPEVANEAFGQTQKLKTGRKKNTGKPKSQTMGRSTIRKGKYKRETQKTGGHE